MFMLLASNAMANQVLGEVNESEPVEGAVTGSETLMIYLSNFYEFLDIRRRWLKCYSLVVRFFLSVIIHMSGL